MQRSPGKRASAPFRRFATRTKFVGRRLWLLPETRPYVIGIGICFAINAAELFFGLANQCVMSSKLYDASCGGLSGMLVFQVLVTVKVAVMTVLVYYSLSSRALMALSYATGINFSRAANLDKILSRGWASASSEEVFQEIVNVSERAPPARVDCQL